MSVSKDAECKVLLCVEFLHFHCAGTVIVQRSVSHSATEKSRATFSEIENILLPDVSNASLRRDDSKSGLAFFTCLKGGGSTEKYLRT